MKSIFKFSILLISLTAISCDEPVRVMKIVNEDGKIELKSSDGLDAFKSSLKKNQSPNPSIENTSEQVHQITVNEILEANKYLYMKVKDENSKEYWIATIKMNAKVGGVYYYKNSLLKRNFESKEYNRIFDEIYLISNLVEANHMNSNGVQSNETSDKSKINDNTEGEFNFSKHNLDKESISIAELVKHKKSLQNKFVIVQGKVTKVNIAIMNLNWIHIEDGTNKGFDLVVTTNQSAEEGDMVKIKAKVILNKDFGAGYKYELILQEGILIN